MQSNDMSNLTSDFLKLRMVSTENSARETMWAGLDCIVDLVLRLILVLFLTEKWDFKEKEEIEVRCFTNKKSNNQII